MPELIGAEHDTLVKYEDDAGTTYQVALPRLGYTNREVRAVAYRMAATKIAAGEWTPYGELRFVFMGRSGL